MSDRHDIIILGSGSTAFAAALRGCSLGARVMMVEKSVLGGTCINWGCIPSKTFIHTATTYHEARRAISLGLAVAPGGIDLARLATHKDDVVRYLRQSRYLDLLREVPGLTLVKGTGRFLDRQTVEVAGTAYRGERFLVATGGSPRVPRIPGVLEADCLTSRSALLLRKLPASLIIIGGGVIALELGQMYQRFGVQVTVLEHGPRVLLPVEEELALTLQEALTAEGMEILLGVTVCSLNRDQDGTTVEAEIAGERRVFRAERVLLAVGTAPASEGIGLDTAGVAVDDKGFIRVDERMRTSAPGIWAAGDVIGGMMIATVGAREGIVAMDDMLTPGCGCRMDYLAAPMAIFTDPEVGTVGLTEDGARKAGYDVVTNTMPVAAIPTAHVAGKTAGVIKMVADRASGRLLGVHLACHLGADLVNEGALALRARLTVEDMANTLHVYPSMAEGLRLCAQGFSRDISRLSCCAE
jgi:mercuric reductase